MSVLALAVCFWALGVVSVCLPLFDELGVWALGLNTLILYSYKCWLNVTSRCPYIAVVMCDGGKLDWAL